MALGSSSLSLFELTRAYAVFANQGRSFKPIFIKKILDQDGNLLEENLPSFYFEDSERGNRSLLLKQRSHYLSYGRVVQHGTGWRARSLGGLWRGRRHHGSVHGRLVHWLYSRFHSPEYGWFWWGKVFGRKWDRRPCCLSNLGSLYVKKLKDKPKKDFSVPEEVEFMKIDPKTGQVSLEKEGILECFREGTGPLQKAPPSLKTSTDFFKFDFNLSINKIVLFMTGKPIISKDYDFRKTRIWEGRKADWVNGAKPKPGQLISWKSHKFNHPFFILEFVSPHHDCIPTDKSFLRNLLLKHKAFGKALTISQ